jgi:hypothetical protein
MNNTISSTELISLLSEKLGALIVGLKIITSPEVKKGGPSDLLKVSTGRIVVGASYQNAVRMQGGDGFVSAPLPWGQWFVSKKIIEHKGELYLAHVRRNSPPMHSFYFSGGYIIPAEKVIPFLRKKGENKRQAEVGVTGKKQVAFKAIKFSSIKTIKYGGKTFELVA